MKNVLAAITGLLKLPVKLVKSIIKLPGIVVVFLKGVYGELKMVEFPTKGTAFRVTHLVIIGSIIVSIVILLIDKLLLVIRGYLTSAS